MRQTIPCILPHAVKLCRSTGNASSSRKSSAVLKILSKNIWDLLKANSTGQDNLRAIHGRDGTRTSINWTKSGNSALSGPTCKDESAAGGFRGGVSGGGRGGKILVAYLQRRKKTKTGERNQGWRWRPRNFAEMIAARRIVPCLGRASPTVRRLDGGPSPSAVCAVRGLRTQRWALARTPGGIASTPPCEPTCPPVHDHWGRPEPGLCACLARPSLLLGAPASCACVALPPDHCAAPSFLPRYRFGMLGLLWALSCPAVR